MNWLYIFALVALLLGFVNGVSSLKSLRSQAQPQAEIAWEQDPLPAWRYEPLSMLTLTIHTLGLIGLTVVLLLNLRDNAVLTFPPGPDRAALFLLSLVSIFFMAHSCGVVSAFHLTRQWVRPISYGIAREGILLGKGLASWKSYHHYELGPEDGQISFYSSYSPSLRTWVIQPSPETFSRVLGIIQENLSPASSLGDSITLQRSPLLLILGMTALVLGTLLPGIWGLLQGRSWVWIYALVAFFLLQILGNRLTTVFDGRGKHPEKKVQTT